MATKEEVQSSVSASVDKLITSASGAAKDGLEFIKKNINAIDINKDGKADFTQVLDLAKKAGGNIMDSVSGATEKVKGIMEAGTDGEGKGEGSALDNNKGTIIGALGMAALAMLALDMGPMGIIMMLLLGAALGGMMDGKNGFLGGLVSNVMGGEKKPEQGQGQGKAPEGPSNTPTHEIMLDKDGKETTDVSKANIAMQGHFEGEGANRKFHSDKVALMTSVDGAAPSLPRDDKGNLVYEDVKRDKGWFPATGEQLKDSPELKAAASQVVKVSKPAAKETPAPQRTEKSTPASEPTTSTKDAGAADPAPASPAPISARDTPEFKAGAQNDRESPEAKPEEKKPEAAKPAESPAPVSDKVALVDPKGNAMKFKTFYVTKEGKETDAAHGEVALHGVQNDNGTFTFTHLAARDRHDNTFAMMAGTNMPKLDTIPEVYKPSVTVPVKDGVLDLTEERTQSVVGKLANSAINKQEAIVKSEEAIESRNERERQQKAEVARLAAIENNTKLRLVSSETDPYNGATTYTFMQRGLVDGEMKTTKFEGHFEASSIGSYGAPSSNLIITRGALVADKSDPITDANNLVSQPIVFKDYKLASTGEVKGISFVPEGVAMQPADARVNVDTLIASSGKKSGITVTQNDVQVQPVGTGQSGPVASR